MLGTLEASGRTVVADLEAGLGTLTRLRGDGVDLVLVVVEPTPKSIDVGARVAALVRATSQGRVIVVANRVRGDRDAAMVRDAFPDAEFVTVPEDPHIGEAERRGVAPLDLAPDAPAVQAIGRLARALGPSDG